MIQKALGSDHLAGWLFVLPAVVLIGVFGILPIGWALLLSFQQNDLLTTPTWVGLDNYRTLVHDPVFRDSIRRTLVYTVLFVPLSVGGAMGVALLLHRPIRFSRFYRTVGLRAGGDLDRRHRDHLQLAARPDLRPRQLLLGKVGLGPYGFFQDPDQALYAIVAMTVWGWLGFDVIIYLAALQGIPEDLLEAAQLDGAGRLGDVPPRRLPLLSPATLFLVVWSTINALQVFDEIYVTTRGGPLHATTVLVYYLYNQAFELFHAGYAAAVAEVLFLDHARVLGGPALARQPAGALHVMRTWPFNPRHLVLIPLSAVMLVPLVWMLVTSIETLRRRATSRRPSSRRASTGRTTPTRSTPPRSAASSPTASS